LALFGVARVCQRQLGILVSFLIVVVFVLTERRAIFLVFVFVFVFVTKIAQPANPSSGKLKNNRKKQFIALLTAIVHCFTHRKQHKMIKVIITKRPCQNVNVLLSNITCIIFAVVDV